MILCLEVNDSGGWRRVMAFDGSDRVNVQGISGMLLQLAYSPRVRARIIVPGVTAPLMTWTSKDGWREWGDHGGAA